MTEKPHDKRFSDRFQHINNLSQVLDSALHNTQQALVQAREGERRAKEEGEKDPLTGILNRKGFETEFRQMVESLGQIRVTDPDFIVFFYFDMNSLKYANDNLGHNVGDKMLKRMATELSEEQAILSANLVKSEISRRAGIVGRIGTGADEFAIAQFGKGEVTQNIHEIVARVKSNINNKLKLTLNDDRVFEFSTAIGGAILTKVDIEELVLQKMNEAARTNVEISRSTIMTEISTELMQSITQSAEKEMHKDKALSGAKRGE